jgi:hypothetical protein
MELDDQLVVWQCRRPTRLPLSLKVVVDVQSLLILCKMQKPKLRLGAAEPVVHLKWVHHLREEWRVSRQKI